MPGQHGESVMDVATADTVLAEWLAAHPYLEPVALFHKIVEETVTSDDGNLPAPEKDVFEESLKKGEPLLLARPLGKDVIAKSAGLFRRLADRLSAPDVPDGVRRECGALHDELRRSPGAAARLIEDMIDAGSRDRQPGIVRFLGWRALRSVLAPWTEGYARNGSDTHWGRPSCPVCGALPAMAQLRRTTKGRERFLSCGCCGTRWNYQRTGCPFCGNPDQDKMEILELEQEKDFRIDACRSCGGYLKTYTREGNENLLLADWSTLHLDVLAKQQGLKRRANSLYEL